MSGPLIVCVAFVYAWIALDQWYRGNSGMAIAYAGYSLSNFGLAMLAK